VRRAFRWFFESRRTGRITIGQWPNIALWVYLAATLLKFTVLATVALVVWSGDEIVRGVNPFRRVLGAAVLLGVVV
jgi:hypothetical protein